MKRIGQYRLEFGLIAAVMLIMVLGFWDIYFGADADAQPHPVNARKRWKADTGLSQRSLAAPCFRPS